MTLQKLVPHAGLVPYQGHSQPDTKWQPLQVHFQDFQMLIFNKLDRGLVIGRLRVRIFFSGLIFLC